MARARAPRGAARRPRTGAPSGHVRIIGGRWRSRRLSVAALAGLRPTPDRVRETLFNWLTPYIAGARCLDLFAGTGALCLEALSRGAARVVMVEHSSAALRQLRANVERLAAAEAEVVAADALGYLQGSAPPFDVVFLDPPFAVAEGMIRDCGERLVHGWLRPGALVYVEAPRVLRTPPVPLDWMPKKQAVAGQVDYRLYQAP